MQNLLPFLVACFALFGSPGPAVMSIAGMGAAFGFRAAFAYAIGIITATLIDGALVLSGIAGLVLLIPGAAVVLFIAASGYMLFLAWKIAAAPPLVRRPDAPHPTFFNGLALGLANPKAYAALAAVFSGHVLIESSALGDGVLKLALVGVVICITDTFWLLLGASLSAALADPKQSRVLNALFAIALVASVAWVAYGALAGH